MADSTEGRKAYSTPQLQDFGSITTLTQGGSGEGPGLPGIPGIDIEIIIDIFG